MKKLFLTTISLFLMTTFAAYSVEQWDSGKVYSSSGNQVLYNGTVYENHWWTKGDNPGGFDSNQWHVWRSVENVEPAPTPTPDPAPVPEPDPIPDPSPSGNLWDSAAVYVGGNSVVYNGNTYEAKWWTQGENPGLSGEWGVWKLTNGNIDPTPTPDPDPTPDPTPTPDPDPTPEPQPEPIVLKNKDIVGYFHTWEGDQLPMTNNKYTIINMAFAEPKSHTDMEMAFNPGYDKELFKQHVKDFQTAGKKVNISIGGANGHVELKTLEDRDKFINSMVKIIEEYNFDGLDIDLEGGSMSLDAGDVDFKNPTTPKIIHFIQAVEYINTYFDKTKEFMITAAPETFYVQVGYSVYGGSAGAYLPVLHALRDELDILHVQLYNTGSVNALDDKAYFQSTSDFAVSMSDMLLTGFYVGRNSNQFFQAFREDQIAFGLPSTPAAAPAGGYTTPIDIIKALDYIINNKSFGGAYTKYYSKKYINFRGVMTWSIQWDSRNDWNFVESMHNYFSKDYNI